MEQIDMLLQPTRFAILRALIVEGKPMYIDQVAEVVDQNPRLVSHHLALLEDEGLVESRFDTIQSDSGRGRGGRFFSVTTKGASVLRKLGALAGFEFGAKGDG